MKKDQRENYASVMLNGPENYAKRLRRRKTTGNPLKAVRKPNRKPLQARLRKPPIRDADKQNNKIQKTAMKTLRQQRNRELASILDNAGVPRRLDGQKLGIKKRQGFFITEGERQL